MKLDKIFEEKVYAGVLGKIIGVYLGRPFEGWNYDRIMRELGPINYYVNEQLGVPLLVTDDDITGTFSFVRALSDYNYDKNITSKQIGQTWLNNIIENETILWWGGVGNSTEHTAYQNLKDGIHAPESGSIKLNGQVVAEQIGSQIFIDGWAMACPGDPERAVDIAGRAARVSHDGEAVYGAQVIAALEAQAFVESDINKLIEVAKKLIPNDSIIYKLICDIQDWRGGNGDWEQAREKIAAKYGYDKFVGNCHMIPNHALIIMSLLYGDSDFQKTLMIVNTAGWDTDCNSGNAGCILGIKDGLKTIDNGPDWRSPVNDIMYCPTANGGQTMTDAVTESYKIIDIAKKMNGEDSIMPKDNARYHFEMPGSVQGWQVNVSNNLNKYTKISNEEGHSDKGTRSLKISYDKVSPGVKSVVYVDTFFPEEVKNLEGFAKKVFFHYNFIACPLITTGQKILASIKADSNNEKPVSCNLFIKIYEEEDDVITIRGEEISIMPGSNNDLSWTVPDTEGNPITQIGIEIQSSETTAGSIYLDYLSINEAAKTSFVRPKHVDILPKGKATKKQKKIESATMWRNSWVKALDQWGDRWDEAFRVSNNSGRGMLITGTNDWKDYTVSSKIRFELVKSGGLAARVQGLQRYYALEVSSGNKLRLIKMLDGLHILKEIDTEMVFQKDYDLSLKVDGSNLKGYLDDKLVLEFDDLNNTLTNGGIGFVVESGTQSTNEIIIN